MNKKDKELLIRDLSSRLSYNVVIHTDFGDYKMIGLVDDRVLTDCEEKGRHNDFPIDVCKPYLRPMPSMTGEEVDEFTQFDIYDDGEYIIPNYQAIDWLNKKWFDYRGLIEKGLAIEVAKENNPYKD